MKEMIKKRSYNFEKRNERLNLEIDKVESLIKNIQDEKELLEKIKLIH